jgi:large subunit ribosomal protein L29
MATPAEIRAFSDAELQERIDDAKEEMFNLRFQRASGQLENTSRVRVVRREVARLKTIQRERQLAAELAKQEGNK